MAFKIFLSHSTKDEVIARAIRKALTTAFRRHIEVYLAAGDILPGEEWKTSIMTRIAGSDAVMSVITKDSYNEPWVVAEWSAFYFVRKVCFVLLADDIDGALVFDPMRDRQSTRLSDDSQVELLFTALIKAADHDGTAYDHVGDFVAAINAARQAKEKSQYERSFAIYRENTRPLPESDREREQIAMYFIETGELEPFERICRAIRDDEAKARLARRLVMEGNPEWTIAVAELLDDNGRLQEIVRQMIDSEQSRTSQFRSLAETLARRNQAEYRKLLVHLADRGEQDQPLFHALLANMSNMAETRKVGEHLAQNRKGFGRALPEVIELIGGLNRVELRKLLGEFIFNGLQREPIFDQAITILAAGNQRELEKLMMTLWEHDREQFARYMDAGIVTDAGVKARLDVLRA